MHSLWKLPCKSLICAVFSPNLGFNPSINYHFNSISFWNWLIYTYMSKKYCLWINLAIFTEKLWCMSSDQWGLWSNQIKSNHFYCHITTAQVPWWVKFLWVCSRQCKKTTNNLPMDRQCKKTTNNLHMDRQCKKTALEHLQCSRQCKKTTTAIYIWTDSAKKNNSNLHMDRQCKKQQQFTYGQYIFTDCTEDNVQNTHTYTQYA